MKNKRSEKTEIILLIKDGEHLHISVHKYKLLPTYLNTLNYETHSKPPKKLTPLRQRFQKIIMYITTVGYTVLLVPHAT
jgi:hypothetical protein